MVVPGEPNGSAASTTEASEALALRAFVEGVIRNLVHVVELVRATKEL